MANSGSKVLSGVGVILGGEVGDIVVVEVRVTVDVGIIVAVGTGVIVTGRIVTVESIIFRVGSIEVVA